MKERFLIHRIHFRKSTICSHLYRGTSRHLRMRTDFSNHQIVKNSSLVRNLIIDMGDSIATSSILTNLSDNFMNLERLLVVGSFVTYLERNFFSGLTNLRSLAVTNHSIKFVLEDSFLDLPNLVKLSIENLMSETRPKVLHINSKSLRVLSLRNNRLTSLDNNFFSNIHSLEKLVLSDNSVELHENVFSELFQLTTLELENCEIKKLPGNLFKNLTNLRVLNLRLNQIVYLEEGLLEQSVHLQSVDFWGNRLKVCDINFKLFARLSLVRLTLDQENNFKHNDQLLFDTKSSQKQPSKFQIFCTLPKTIDSCACDFSELDLLQYINETEAYGCCNRTCHHEEKSMFWCQNVR